MIRKSICADRVLGHPPRGNLLRQSTRASGQQLSERIIGHNGRKADAVSKETGETCSDFGDQGESICLRAWKSSPVTTCDLSPTVANDTLVLGGWVLDNETEEPSVVRGFNPVTGALSGHGTWDGRIYRPSCGG